MNNGGHGGQDGPARAGAWLAAIVAALLVLCPLAGGQGLLGAGALLEERAGVGPSVAHAWVVVPAANGEQGAEVLHLAPRGVLGEHDGRVIGVRAGDARGAASLLSA